MSLSWTNEVYFTASSFWYPPCKTQEHSDGRSFILKHLDYETYFPHVCFLLLPVQNIWNLTWLYSPTLFDTHGTFPRFWFCIQVFTFVEFLKSAFQLKLNYFWKIFFQIDAASGRLETYSSVNEKAVRLALHLKDCGVSPGDVVVSCFKHRMESLIPYLATLYLGAKICVLSPTQSKLEFVNCLNVLSPKIIFSEDICAELLRELCDYLTERPKIVVLGQSKECISFEDFQQPLPGEKEFQPERCENCHETAIIVFTSGSTGLPKPVGISHFGLLNGTKNVV